MVLRSTTGPTLSATTNAARSGTSDRKNKGWTLPSAEGSDGAHCHKGIIQRIVWWSWAGSGAGAGRIREGSPSKLVGKKKAWKRPLSTDHDTAGREQTVFLPNPPGEPPLRVWEKEPCSHFLREPLRCYAFFSRKRKEKQCHVVKGRANRSQSWTIALVFVWTVEGTQTCCFTEADTRFTHLQAGISWLHDFLQDKLIYINIYMFFLNSRLYYTQGNLMIDS